MRGQCRCGHAPHVSDCECGCPPRCDSLVEFTVHGYTTAKRRKPFELDVLLRCARDAGHDGEHRSARRLRSWRDEWTDGWIEDATDDTRPTVM